MPTTTHQMTVAKATPSDFEAVRNLLLPMENLFNSHWIDEENWTEWRDDDPNKIELLKIRKQIAREEDYSESDVDNRIILFEFIKRRMKKCACSEWNRVVMAAEICIDTFCDPNVDHLAFNPELVQAIDYWNEHHKEEQEHE